MPAYSSPLDDFLPGPYVRLRVKNGDDHRDLLGLLDTGSDQTTIPIHAAEALGLQELSDDIVVRDASGGEEDGRLFLADVEFQDVPIPPIVAFPVAGTRYPVALIGRDVLNDYIATFRGPELTFDVA